MVLFWKATSGVLVAMILILAVEKQEKDMAMLLSMIVCVMTVSAAASFWIPVVNFMKKLETLADTQFDILGILLKICGIGIISEITALTLTDSGNTSIAKGVQLLASAVMLSLSVPVFETLLTVIQQILGEL